MIRSVMMLWALLLVLMQFGEPAQPQRTPVQPYQRPASDRMDTRKPREETTVGRDGHYLIVVPHDATVGPGPAYIPWQFNLRRADGGYYDSVFLADVRPVTEEMASFQQDFKSTGVYIAQRARALFGDLLADISFDIVHESGTPIYVMRISLDDGMSPLSATAAWCFGKSYAASYIGVNLGDMPDMGALVLQAAAAFEDNTDSPGSGEHGVISTGAFALDPGPWDLPVENVLGVISEYAPQYRDFRQELAGGEAEIVWRHAHMETLARKIAQKPEGPVYPSDLAHITQIYLEADDPLGIRDGAAKANGYAYTIRAYGPYHQLDIDDVYYTFSAENPVRDLNGLEYYSITEYLQIALPDVVDVSALEALSRVERAMLSFSTEIADLTPMGGMTALQELMMWGTAYPRVTDISFFASLTNLERVFFISDGVSDASIFTQLPNLRELYLNAADTLDKQPLIDCAHIEMLMLNTEIIRTK